MGRIYIVGSEGYIGSELKKLFDGQELFCISKQKRAAHSHVSTKLPTKVSKNSVCFLLAGLAGEERCEENRKLAYETNILLAQQVCALDFDKVILTSTSSLYGNSVGYVTEEDPVQVTSYYIESKLKAEQIVKAANKKNIVARLAITVGASDRMNWDQLFNIMFKSIMQKEIFRLYGAKAYRPYCDIRDICQGLKFLKETDIYNGQIVNVGSTEHNYKKIDLIHFMKNVYPSFKYETFSEDDKRNYKVSFKKFEKLKRDFHSLTSILKSLADNYHKEVV